VSDARNGYPKGQSMSDVRRYALVDCGFDEYQVMPMEGGEWVHGDDHDAAIAAKDAEIERLRAALETDCNIMCNALQRIEAGETEPRMIARRTLEHWSEKAALATAETEVKL
jgi:hypothetical protein